MSSINIAIDVSPLQSGHKVRGTGFYLQYLKESLLQYFPQYEYTFFTQGENIPKNTNVVHYPYFEPFSLTLPKVKKTRTVVTVHDLTPLIFPEHFPAGLRGHIKWQIQKFLLKNIADAIVTDSVNSKKDIVRIIGFPVEKISIAYLAAGKEFKKTKITNHTLLSIKKKYKLPEKFALYVGDVTWNKNLPRLVKAFQGTAIPLVMVGKALINQAYDTSNVWNKDLLEIQKLINGDKNIILPGFISTEDVVLLYNIATVFVMPSLYEGFGLPIVEAMSCGCPVVTTKEGSLAEVAGDAAYYVDAYSTESIKKGIQEVFLNSKLQKELCIKGFIQAKKFSWEKTAQQTMDVYKEVIRK